MTNQRLQWIFSGGGPLVMMERRILSSWSGYSDMNLDPLDARHDYGRACEVDDWIGIIAAGDGHAIVLGGDPSLSATWIALSSASTYFRGIVARWQYATEERVLQDDLARILDSHFSEPVVEIAVHSTPLLLFDSAFPGNRVHGDHLEIDLPQGRYIVRTLVYEPNEDTSFVLHSFESI